MLGELVRRGTAHLFIFGIVRIFERDLAAIKSHIGGAVSK